MKSKNRTSSQMHQFLVPTASRFSQHPFQLLPNATPCQPELKTKNQNIAEVVNKYLQQLVVRLSTIWCKIRLMKTHRTHRNHCLICVSWNRTGPKTNGAANALILLLLLLLRWMNVCVHSRAFCFNSSTVRFLLHTTHVLYYFFFFV